MVNAILFCIKILLLCPGGRLLSHFVWRNGGDRLVVLWNRVREGRERDRMEKRS